MRGRASKVWSSAVDAIAGEGDDLRRQRFWQRLRGWYAREGRHDLPWQKDRRGYAVWVSEIMLQQTPVGTVLHRYPAFLRRFPTLRSLAAASRDDVLHAWSGLGYYRRAHHLHEAARLVVERHGGRLPRTIDDLVALPGIGRSTAGAILSLAYDRPAVVLDTNVRRVLERFWGDLHGRLGRGESALWDLASWLLPPAEGRVHTQALMDLGALLCRPRDPDCGRCPLRADCPGPRSHGREGKRVFAPRRRRLGLRLLLMRDARGRIFLVRRPERGIWGGLWCLPEGGTWPKDGLGPLLGRRRHALSHVALEIRLFEAQVPEDQGLLPDGRWTTARERSRLAIPPIILGMLESLAPS